MMIWRNEAMGVLSQGAQIFVTTCVEAGPTPTGGGIYLFRAKGWVMVASPKGWTYEPNVTRRVG